MTIDESCLDEEGKYLDKPYTVRMVQWQPFQVKDHFLKEPDGKQVPVCASCKKTNRTRQFCREKHCHRQLPWCTVYVMMSALDSTDPSTIVAGPSVPVGQPLEEVPTGGGKRGQERAAKIAKAAAEQRAESARIRVAKDCDDINAVPESRTFLAMVSCQEISVKWVELADFDPHVNPETGVHASVRSQEAGAAQAQAQAGASAAAAGQAGAHPQASAGAAYQQGQPTTMQEYFAQLAAMGYSPQEQQQAWAAYMGMGAQAAHAAHAQHAQYAQYAAQQAYAAQAHAHAQANGQHHGGHPAYAAHWGHMSPGAAAAAYGHPGGVAASPGGAAPHGEEAQGEDGDAKPSAGEAAEAANAEETNGGEAKQDEANPPVGHYPHPHPHPHYQPDQAAMDPHMAHQHWLQHNAYVYQQQMHMQHEHDNMHPNPLSGAPHEASAEDFDGLGHNLNGGDGGAGGDDDDLHQHQSKRQRTDDGEDNSGEAV